MAAVRSDNDRDFGKVSELQHPVIFILVAFFGPRKRLIDSASYPLLTVPVRLMNSATAVSRSMKGATNEGDPSKASS